MYKERVVLCPYTDMNRKLLAVAGALLFLPMYAALAASLNQLVVFGDSLSDNGNAAAALIAAGQPSLASMDYAANALTDGPNTTPATHGPLGVWVDQLAAKMNLPDPQPFYTPALGNNYAFAGANTGSGSPFEGPLSAFDISNQVTAFVIGHPLGGAPSNALYTIWGGANDLFNGVHGGKTAADNLYGNILTLSGDGAKNFLWLNLPNLGETPRGVLQGAAALSSATTDFNNEWALDLASLKSQGINVIGVDINSLFNQILLDRMAYGFQNVMTPAQGTSATTDPNTYLFWDVEHPTTAGDALVADAALNALAAPEPFSAGLSIIGLGAVLAARKLRRKSASN